MRNITEMKTLQHSEVNSMVWDIEIKISEGWHPYGAVFQEHKYLGQYAYYQIMVKYQDEPAPPNQSGSW